MYKVNVFSKGKQIGTHWYSKENEANDAAFALHNHPLFGFRTAVEHKPNARIGYESK